jgi:hypothetical protein
MKGLGLSILLIFAFFFTMNVDAQRWKARRYEAIVGIGSANSYGDIGGAMTEQNWWGLKDIQLAKTRPSLALGVRYKLNGLMAVKANFYTGFLTGSDEGSKNAGTRDYSFKATIYEYSAQYEYYVYSEVRGLSSAALYNKRGMVNDILNINIYLFAGFGSVYSNANVTDYSTANNGNNDQFKRFDSDGYLIHDVYTTATGPRPNSALVFPFGVGVKYIWSKDWSFGAEFGRRYTTFDYLDGYSAYNPELQVDNRSKDLYDFMSFSLIYRMPTDRRGLPVFGRKAALRE